ncbi:MAG: radical SAM family heme chaperone HemW [Crocinitomicaceae bacterium]|nr:radical SAM family heme chaperone HemW [Crocinitomicaceae bacterium]
MAGIYLHIPFCRKACYYCDFHFSTVMERKNELIDSLHSELAIRNSYLQQQDVETIYFGGGTPSLLQGDEIKRLLDGIHRHYVVSDQAEITLEANPDDLSGAKTKELLRAGINRLSIGIQSFREADLKWMNRSHTVSQADYSVKAAQDAGISNITIDLIYGIPGMPIHDWKTNLHNAFDLKVKHISAYCLTIEPRTVFGHRSQKGQMQAADDEEAGKQFIVMTELMEEAGFLQYEVSNFCIPGFESKHNTSYWQGKHYLGVGPSAHSFDGTSRQWNVSSNPAYTRDIFAGKLPFEREELDLRTRANEYIMTRLRTIQGIDVNVFQQEFGRDIIGEFSEEIERLKEEGKMIASGSHIRLTKHGLLLADRIASDFFILEN